MEPDINKIQQVVGKFLPDNTILTEASAIDNSVIQGSVKLHLMYGELADMGYKVEDFMSISTFGDLLKELNGSSKTKSDNSILVNNAPESKKTFVETNNIDRNLNVGVDILKIKQLPKVDDYRESSFYTENFSQEEISYCLLKSSPLESFAGKFAAKEAIIKSDSSLKGKAFNEIEIKYNELGQPYFLNFSLSISHDEEYAVAMAINNGNLQDDSKYNETEKYLKTLEEKVSKQKNELDKLGKKIRGRKIKGLVILSLILNLGILAFILYKHFIGS